jgi:hypothetical protein
LIDCSHAELARSNHLPTLAILCGFSAVSFWSFDRRLPAKEKAILFASGYGSNQISKSLVAQLNPCRITDAPPSKMARLFSPGVLWRLRRIIFWLPRFSRRFDPRAYLLHICQRSRILDPGGVVTLHPLG